MLTVEEEEVRAFETSEAAHPVGRRRIQQEAKLQHCLYEDPHFLNKRQGVRTLWSVGSQTQLSPRCNFVLKNNCMFRPMMAIVSLPWEYFRANCKLYRAHNVEICTCSCFSIHNCTSVTAVFDCPHFTKFSHTQRGWHCFWKVWDSYPTGCTYSPTDQGLY